MKKVTRCEYETDDGKFFGSAEEAEGHEKFIVLAGELDSADDIYWGDTDAYTVAAWIFARYVLVKKAEAAAVLSSPEKRK